MTITINNIEYTYTKREGVAGIVYNLTGPRGATYFTIRNPQTGMMAAFSNRSPGRALPGFLTDTNDKLEVADDAR